VKQETETVKTEATIPAASEQFDLKVHHSTSNKSRRVINGHVSGPDAPVEPRIAHVSNTKAQPYRSIQGTVATLEDIVLAENLFPKVNISSSFKSACSNTIGSV
jgi:hypothetical protein